jgi:hypothetical protein
MGGCVRAPVTGYTVDVHAGRVTLKFRGHSYYIEKYHYIEEVSDGYVTVSQLCKHFCCVVQACRGTAVMHGDVTTQIAPHNHPGLYLEI